MMTCDDLFDQDPHYVGSVRAKRGTVVDCGSDVDTDADTIYAGSAMPFPIPTWQNTAIYCL